MMQSLKSLRALMKKENIDIFIHFNTDPHNSEYISNHYKGIRYLTGFSGSNATVVVTQKEAGLWTDGRYFIQADRELKKSGVKLFKLNTKGYPSVKEFVSKKAEKNSVIAFDGRLMSKEDFDSYSDISKEKKANLKPDGDLISAIWKEREPLENTKAFVLGEEYAGKSFSKKLAVVKGLLKRNKADAIILNDLCDIAWITNLRADDIPFVPVFFSYLYISKDKVALFTGKDTLDKKSQKYLKDQCKDIEFFDLEEFYSYLANIKDKKVLCDPKVASIAMVNALDASCKIIDVKAPIESLRAVKNATEIRNLNRSHINDGAVLTKMIFKIKRHVLSKKAPLTETDIVKELTKLRKKYPDYIEDSFATIAAYKGNAAMMHYSPKEGDDSQIEDKGFLLIDTGGHYLTGTTDVTRTIALGKLSYEEKYNYTRVLKSHLALMDAIFPKGVTGENLDILSRRAFWENCDDYLSGTGHGVGYLLSVHEGPNGIRWRYTGSPAPIEPGMVTTDEPGYYVEGKYGIRIENELLCVPYKKSEYGEYYRFKPLTFVPYERDAILYEMLSEKEKDIFNRYNRLVYKNLKGEMTKQELAWLYLVTRPI